MQASFSIKSMHSVRVINRRVDPMTQVDVATISDLTRPFAIVLLKQPSSRFTLSPESHLGVACESREEIDRLCNEARSEGILLKKPYDWVAIQSVTGLISEILTVIRLKFLMVRKLIF